MRQAFHGPAMRCSDTDEYSAFPESHMEVKERRRSKGGEDVRTKQKQSDYKSTTKSHQPQYM